MSLELAEWITLLALTLSVIACSITGGYASWMNALTRPREIRESLFRMGSRIFAASTVVYAIGKLIDDDNVPQVDAPTLLHYGVIVLLALAFEWLMKQSLAVQLATMASYYVLLSQEPWFDLQLIGLVALALMSGALLILWYIEEERVRTSRTALLVGVALVVLLAFRLEASLLSSVLFVATLIICIVTLVIYVLARRGIQAPRIIIAGALALTIFSTGVLGTAAQLEAMQPSAQAYAHEMGRDVHVTISIKQNQLTLKTWLFEPYGTITKREVELRSEEHPDETMVIDRFNPLPVSADEERLLFPGYTLDIALANERVKLRTEGSWSANVKLTAVQGRSVREFTVPMKVEVMMK